MATAIVDVEKRGFHTAPKSGVTCHPETAAAQQRPRSQLPVFAREAVPGQLNVLRLPGAMEERPQGGPFVHGKAERNAVVVRTKPDLDRLRLPRLRIREKILAGPGVRLTRRIYRRQHRAKLGNPGILG